MSSALLDASCLRLLSEYQSIYVGLSGGLDSVALFHALASKLSPSQTLTAIHVNHGISAQADLWEAHCVAFSKKLKRACIVKQVPCKVNANQEAVAREARYAAFDAVLAEVQPDTQCALVLAHHQRDQAETLLLNLLRGAGVDGFCGIWPWHTHRGYPVLRPCLGVSRQAFLDYAKAHELEWVEDESNQDTAYDRNYLRHEVFALLEARWPKATETLSRATQHAQQVACNLFELACMDCPELVHTASNKAPVLNLKPLLSLSQSRLSNVIWQWLKAQQVYPLNQVRVQRVMNELVLNAQSGGRKLLFSGHELRCYQNQLWLIQSRQTQPSMQRLAWTTFPQALKLPEGQLKPTLAQGGFLPPAESRIEVRSRQGGEQFYWHGQTKSLKKLLQAWGVPAWERQTLPLVYVNGQLAVVPGFAVSDAFYTAALPAYTIEWIRDKHD